ncbi:MULTISPECIES: leucine-rich repeat domain-containing protein [Bacteroidaceae]|uniref:leucine-rich repeat domain-containing protein n=1 Tax=Bacteroidaceae TaxID=815 RepID=UPI0011DD2617|nr:leucine-rich repeat domain-containing protein [Bacteroides sp.]
MKALHYMEFHQCTNLESVTLMPNIKKIGGRVFAGCISLKRMTIPSSIETIESGVFDGCTSLLTVDIPSTYIPAVFPDSMFKGCSSLTSLIEIPDTVITIGQTTFMGCCSLEGVKMKGTTPPTLGYGVFNDTTFPIYVPQEAVNTYKSASGWTSVSSRIVGY